MNKGNYETFRAIHRNPKPVIVALHSFVLGGGIGMAGAADIILCSDCARFGVPEIDRGAMGGGAHLQRMFPVQKVRYMYFTGEFIDAQEAYRLGAVERVVPLDKLLPTAREIAGEDRGEVSRHGETGQGGSHRNRGRQPGRQVPLGAGLYPGGLYHG